MTCDTRSHDVDGNVDPDLLQILGQLVDLAGAIPTALDYAEHALTGYAVWQVAANVAKSSRAPRTRAKTAIAGIRKAIGRIQVGLAAIDAIEDVSKLRVVPRRNGFGLKKSVMPSFEHGMREVQAGLGAVRRHADQLRDLHAGVPELAMQEHRMSESAATLVDELAEALKALAATANQPKKHATEVHALLERARAYCQEAQARLDVIEGKPDGRVK